MDELMNAELNDIIEAQYGISTQGNIIYPSNEVVVQSLDDELRAVILPNGTSVYIDGSGKIIG